VLIEVFTYTLPLGDQILIVKELFDDEHQRWYTRVGSENGTVLFEVLGVYPERIVQQMYSVYDQAWDAGYDCCGEQRGSY